MSNKRKRFQSGREVFKTYIPGYQSPVQAESESRKHSVAEDATNLAASLLRQFEAQLATVRN